HPGLGARRLAAAADAPPNLGRRIWQERNQDNAEEAQRVGQRDQHAIELGRLRRILRESPWLRGVDVSIDGADELPDRLERPMERELLHRALDAVARFVRRHPNLL